MRMASQVQSGLATGSEGLVCFVCDVGVVGRYYALATCRTQTTKVRLIEKLGQLVGDDYMVVISEDDVICRGCATMINSLDRLEKEVGSLRSIVLRYLEKKYDMEDGELVNARPQSQSKSPIKDTKTSSSPTDFQSRKRKAMSAEIDSEEFARENSGKDNIWLQCDRCKYTTQYNAFMVHHVRSHNKEKSEGMETGSLGMAEAPIEKQNGEDKQAGLHMQHLQETQEPEFITPDMEPVEVKKDVSSMSESSETVEMIAAEIGQDFTAEESTQEVSGERSGGGGGGETATSTTPTATMLVAGSGKQVTLQAVEGEDGANTICMVDENGMIVQKVEQAEDGTLYVQMADNSDPTKQMISVGEDGSVQMVEVLWDDMVGSATTEEGDQHTMVTF